MKLLFLTQVIDADDAVLGFVPRWIQGLARHCERVRVVALEAGNTSSLPRNVDVRVIGRKGFVRRYLRYRSVLREAFVHDHFDTVLSHMVPRYALVANGPARRAGAKNFLWYTHSGVDQRLARAVQLVDRVFTASPESMRVDTPLKVVTGHGIDLDHFDRREEIPAQPPRLLAVGRLTPAKDPLVVLEALALLVARGHDLSLDLVGEGLTVQDQVYASAVSERIETLGVGARVHRLGAVPYRDIAAHYARASVVVNASLTGSVDKVVLEAMASRRPVVSCNEAIPGVLASLGERAAALSFAKGDAAGLASRIEALLVCSPAERERLGRDLRAIVARDHEVDTLMERLVREMGGTT